MFCVIILMNELMNLPMQFLGPVPNGMKENGLMSPLFSSENLSGSKDSGSL